ncbi:MAG: hypothetical protein Fur005_03870 [Roseiflexaceae bacterium]
MTKQPGMDLLNPFAAMRSLRDMTLDVWSKTAIEAVNTDTFAQWLGIYLNTTLAVSAPFQRAIDQSMETILPRLHLPSREELASVAGRMTNIELRLDDMDARSDDLLAALQAPAPAATPDIGRIEGRIDALEAKLDAILAALQAQQAAKAPVAPPAPKPTRRHKAASTEAE